MTNCLETTVLCYTPRPPVWVGDNRSCKFGPHNVAYEGLREQLEEVRERERERERESAAGLEATFMRRALL